MGKKSNKSVQPKPQEPESKITQRKQEKQESKVQQKTEKPQTQQREQLKQKFIKDEKEEQKKNVSAFGLNFHSQQVLNQFLMTVILMIVVPIGGFFIAKTQFEEMGFSEKHQYTYSGGVAVFLVQVVMITYCVNVVRDKENFTHEQRFMKLNPDLLKKEKAEKIKEAYDQCMDEHEIDPEKVKIKGFKKRKAMEDKIEAEKKQKEQQELNWIQSVLGSKKQKEQQQQQKQQQQKEQQKKEKKSEQTQKKTEKKPQISEKKVEKKQEKVEEKPEKATEKKKGKKSAKKAEEKPEEKPKATKKSKKDKKQPQKQQQKQKSEQKQEAQPQKEKQVHETLDDSWVVVAPKK